MKLVRRFWPLLIFVLGMGCSLDPFKDEDDQDPIIIEDSTSIQPTHQLPADQL